VCSGNIQGNQSIRIDEIMFVAERIGAGITKGPTAKLFYWR
jgi:hypothetical protein